MRKREGNGVKDCEGGFFFSHPFIKEAEADSHSLYLYVYMRSCVYIVLCIRVLRREREWWIL